MSITADSPLFFPLDQRARHKNVLVNIIKKRMYMQSENIKKREAKNKSLAAMQKKRSL